jgi:AcrR family transcriptional regulator
MGINRVSMYATFGNKEALYVKAMERFCHTRENHVAACLSACSAREAVQKLLLEGVRMFTSPEGPGVCFVTQGPFEASSVSEQTRDYMARRRAGIERMLRELFERSIETGELPRHVSSSELALFYSVVIQGMALQAQHGGTQEQLESVIGVALAAWPHRI